MEMCGLSKAWAWQDIRINYACSLLETGFLRPCDSECLDRFHESITKHKDLWIHKFNELLLIKKALLLDLYLQMLFALWRTHREISSSQIVLDCFSILKSCVKLWMI